MQHDDLLVTNSLRGSEVNSFDGAESLGMVCKAADRSQAGHLVGWRALGT
jgi:hypothetical protein